MMIVLSKIAMRLPLTGKFLLSSSKNKEINFLFSKGFRQKPSIKKVEKFDLSPEFVIETPRINNMVPGLFKSFLFTVGFCGSVYAGAMIWQYERFRKKAKSSTIKNWADNKWNEFNNSWVEKQGDLRKHLNRWWNELSNGEKLFWPICFTNVLVFACWLNPAFSRTMTKYFTVSPAAKAVCWPMVLSTFSHYSLIHLGLNMYVLHSFMASASNFLSQEQLLAMYLSGGVVSSFASSVFKVASRNVSPSIGASGAILTLLGYFCSISPTSELSIVFIPNFSFSADSAIKFIIGFDLAGIIFRWKLFDHAAHLGGVLFGVWYAHYGQQIWRKREPFLTKWHEIRNKIESIDKD